MSSVRLLSVSVYNLSYCTALQGKNRTDRITPKLCGACYVVRSGFYSNDYDPVKAIYCGYFHSVWTSPATDKQVAWQEL